MNRWVEGNGYYTQKRRLGCIAVAMINQTTGRLWLLSALVSSHRIWSRHTQKNTIKNSLARNVQSTGVREVGMKKKISEREFARKRYSPQLDQKSTDGSSRCAHTLRRTTNGSSSRRKTEAETRWKWSNFARGCYNTVPSDNLWIQFDCFARTEIQNANSTHKSRPISGLKIP